jgi:hypothetical protein
LARKNADPGSSAVPLEVVHHGVIREDATDNEEVKMDVPLQVTKGLEGKEICGYTIYKSSPENPFSIIDVDRLTGTARIVLAPGALLDFEKKHKYQFEIAAHDCQTGEHAEREKVHIEVEDVNEYAPVWPHSHMSVSAVEGRIYDYLIRLEALDKDGADGISRICRYRIITHDVPFEVDADGYLRNTEPLSYSLRKSYNIEVKAEDCGGRMSDSGFVTVSVKPVCQTSWSGINDRVEFMPHEGRKLIAAGAELELCDNACNLTRVTVTVKLATDHIGKGCDRDTYSLHSQRKLCGATDASIDLLPNPMLGSWTKDLPTDDGQESDQIFAFDGKSTAIEIPAEKIDFSLGAVFTISTWMKHGSEDGSDDLEGEGSSGAKEQILCHSDGDGMNRHHYSLFIHNCRLVLLLRQEPPRDDSADSARQLRPAEWRWMIPEVCDGRWHHYAVSVEFPEVRLYIDGKRFVETHNNPDIVDDWPLHSQKQVHFTKLVVGACWQGAKRRMGQYFGGYLAGLSILKNRTESDGVISCLNNCQEKLDFTAIDTMDETSVSINSDRTTVIISGRNLDSVETLLHRVGYVNSRTFPTPGHRPVTMETQAVCSDGKQLTVSPTKTLVMVLDAERPTITITSTRSRAVDEHDLSHGVHVFADLVIDAHTKTEENELKSGTDDSKTLTESATSSKLRDRFMLDSCLIRVDPQLSITIEHLRHPENLVAQLSLEVDFSEDGLVIAGAGKLSDYEEVLRGVRYVNSEPQELNSRSFVLTCTELNGRFVSNELQATLIVVRVAPTPEPAHIVVDHKMSASVAKQQPVIARTDYRKLTDSSQSGIGVAAVIVACIGFVVLLIALGVARIRNTKRHSNGAVTADIPGIAVDDKQEMEWDNLALTITVNPMDQEVMYDDEMPAAHGVGSRSDSIDSDGSDVEYSIQNHDAIADDTSDEEEEVEEPEGTEKAKSTRELEWDDSTLSF